MRRIGFMYRYIEFIPFWISKNKKNVKVQKFEILFKFAYIERYLTENTGTVRYLVVQTGTGWYLTGIISNINVYRFLTGTVWYGRYRSVRYGIYNYGWNGIPFQPWVKIHETQMCSWHVAKRGYGLERILAVGNARRDINVHSIRNLCTYHN